MTRKRSGVVVQRLAGDLASSGHSSDADQLRLLQAEVYDFFCQVREATQLDVEHFFADHSSTYRSRVPELVRKGFLRCTGKKFQNGKNRLLYALQEKYK